MSFLRGFLSAPSEEQKQQGGVETIERLCERLETATLLDDRRDAIRALRALSKTFQVEVGTHAMDMLISVVREDSTDIEVTEMIIETLLNVMASKGETPSESDLGVQFTEIFIKTEDNVSLLLSLLEEYEFHIRWPTVRLLILLLKNRSKDLQERVLDSPMGISKLMDLLSDSREIIRNDGLLLMIKLTKNNPSIQKIVAFENAFERLLHIVSVEGNSDGGIIVEDCLSLLLNLLRNNLSNQNFFRETSNIQRITPYFEMPSQEEEEEEEDTPVWAVQKQTNILLMLDILQVLINPTNNPQSVVNCQKVMYTRGIYMRLMDLLLFPNLASDIFAKLLVTIGDIIRGNEIIQQFMDELEMSERPAILLILMFMVNDKQPFKSRLAALYCVQCFLFRNVKGQARIVSTLLPNQEDVQTSVTSGQLLCAGLFSNDPVAHWLSSVTLSHCLYNNPTQHQNMLLVQLELLVGEPPVLLINQVFTMLSTESDIRTRFGCLMLLLHWADDCGGAVATLLQNNNFIPYILELVEHRDGQDSMGSLMSSLGALLLGMCLKYNDGSFPLYNKSTLLHLITQRIGTPTFTELLESASVLPSFTSATKTPHPTADSTEVLVLDYTFTKFYKKQQDLVSKSLDDDEDPEADHNTIESHDQIVTGYKELIKQQDGEICSLKEQLSHQNQVGGSQVTSQQLEQLQNYSKDQEVYYQQYIEQLQTWYNNQITQLQSAQTSTQASNVTSPSSNVTSPPSNVTSSERDSVDVTLYNSLLAERDSLNSEIRALQTAAQDTTSLSEKLSNFEKENDLLSHTLQSRNTEITEITEKLADSESQVEELTRQSLALRKQSVALQEKLSQSEQGFQILRHELKGSAREDNDNSNGEIVELEKCNNSLKEELQLKSSEITELLEMLEQLRKETSSQASETPPQASETPPQASETPPQASETPPQASETPPQASETPPQEEQKQYLYDYSQWFQEVEADDGVRYFVSTEGHYYTTEQYLHTLDQYDQYYRAQQSDQQNVTDNVTENQQNVTDNVTENQQNVTDNVTENQQNVTETVTENQQNVTETVTENQQNVTDNVTENQQNVTETVTENQQNVTETVTDDDTQRSVTDSTPSATQPEPSIISKEEYERQLVKVRESEEEIERLKKKLEQSQRNVTLSKSATVHHEIKKPERNIQKSEIKQIDINGDSEPPLTPDMVSSSTDCDLTLLQEKYDSLQAEQEDLLVLLALQDKRLATLKNRLRELGEDITSSDSEDDFDDLLEDGDVIPLTDQLTGDGRLM